MLLVPMKTCEQFQARSDYHKYNHSLGVVRNILYVTPRGVVYHKDQQFYRLPNGRPRIYNPCCAVRELTRHIGPLGGTTLQDRLKSRAKRLKRFFTIKATRPQCNMTWRTIYPICAADRCRFAISRVGCFAKIATGLTPPLHGKPCWQRLQLEIHPEQPIQYVILSPANNPGPPVISLSTHPTQWKAYHPEPHKLFRRTSSPHVQPTILPKALCPTQHISYKFAQYKQPTTPKTRTH